MSDGAGEPVQTHSRDHHSRHDLDADVDDANRVRARAREDADGTLARLWTRLRALLRRD